MDVWGILLNFLNWRPEREEITKNAALRTKKSAESSAFLFKEPERFCMERVGWKDLKLHMGVGGWGGGHNVECTSWIIRDPQHQAKNVVTLQWILGPERRRTSWSWSTSTWWSPSSTTILSPWSSTVFNSSSAACRIHLWVIHRFIWFFSERISKSCSFERINNSVFNLW